MKKSLSIFPEFNKYLLKKMKRILFIVATHGNEKIGLEVMKMLEEIGYDKYLDYLIANPKALERNSRFVDVDMNRSYPGKKYSKAYEKRMAFRNLAIAKKYEFIIDFHEASEGRDNFIIIPREKISKKFPLQYIDLRKILLWPDPKGSISQILRNAIELEFGMKDKKREEIVLLAFKIAKKFIEKIINAKYKRYDLRNKNVYYVHDKLMQKDFSGNVRHLIDFEKADINGEVFFPLLVKQYMEEGIICYKMKEIK
jgi:succinylglutamate desuccinylase